MKHKRIKVLYIIFFIAAVFFAAFVLAEYRKDYLAVGLAGVLMLIAAYFLVDKIEQDIYDKFDLNRLDLDDMLDRATGEIREGYSKIDQLSEAIMKASLQGISDPNQKISQFVDELSATEQSLKEYETRIRESGDGQNQKKELELIIQNQKETISLIKTGFKALIQYSKENARQVALNNNQNTEQTLTEISGLIKQLSMDLPMISEGELGDVEKQNDSISQTYSNNFSLVNQKLDRIEELTKEISKSIKE